MLWSKLLRNGQTPSIKVPAAASVLECNDRGASLRLLWIPHDSLAACTATYAV
jgi:hypothetical protein